ncbi:MAG: hypothetical protein IPM76_17630 [Chloroflexi bacterium]|nr:hypothetical protein [Chloroflexota bacterium]
MAGETYLVANGRILHRLVTRHLIHLLREHNRRRDGAKRPSPLSYDGRSDRWPLMDDSVSIQAVGRGQEFVLDTNHDPAALTWLRALFTEPLAGSQ